MTDHDPDEGPGEGHAPDRGSERVPAGGVELTIEQLALQSGFTSRNIRDFQAHGLLPPPERKGRLGYYGDEHLVRLRLIGRLQSEGFSRAAIGALIEAWNDGRTLADVLGFEHELSGFLSIPLPLPRLAPEQVLQLLGADIDLLGAVIDAGVLRQVDDGYEVCNPAMFDVGSELRDAGIPLEVVLDQAQYLRQRSDEIANHFVHMFMTMIWQPFAERGAPEEELANMTQTLRRLRPLITRSIDAAMEESMTKAVSNVLHQVIATGASTGPSTEPVEPIAAVIDLA